MRHLQWVPSASDTPTLQGTLCRLTFYLPFSLFLSPILPSLFHNVRPFLASPSLIYPSPQTTGSHILNTRRGEGHQGSGWSHILHHGAQSPVGCPLDELAGVPHLLEQAAGDLLSLLIHVLLQDLEEVSQGADGQAGHLGAEVGDLGEREERDPP